MHMFHGFDGVDLSPVCPQSTLEPETQPRESQNRWDPSDFWKGSKVDFNSQVPGVSRIGPEIKMGPRPTIILGNPIFKGSEGDSR